MVFGASGSSGSRVRRHWYITKMKKSGVETICVSRKTTEDNGRKRRNGAECRLDS